MTAEDRRTRRLRELASRVTCSEVSEGVICQMCRYEGNGCLRAWALNGEWPAVLDTEGDRLQDGVALIAAERRRQVRAEDWTPVHDDTHTRGELARAAACYALQHTTVSGRAIRWPWDKSWWKPKNPIRDLTRAGALIAAEIDRLRRADPKSDWKAALDAEEEFSANVGHRTPRADTEGDRPHQGASMTEPWAGDPRIKELEWVLNRAEEIIRDEYGKNAAYAFVEAWGQLPKELRTPIEPTRADTE